MIRRKAKDGAHTVFTDHQISRIPQAADDKSPVIPPVEKIAAWHAPAGALALRNLGLANIEIGERDHSAGHMEEGARQLIEAHEVASARSGDAHQSRFGASAQRRGIRRHRSLRIHLGSGSEPGWISRQSWNAYKQAGQTDKAVSELERAIQLDPSLETAYRSLGEIFVKA
jgi:tetratricopeptide (TPR) repeat protein